MVLEQLMPIHFHQRLTKLMNKTNSARLNIPMFVTVHNSTVYLLSSLIVSYMEKKLHLGPTKEESNT